MAAIDRPRACNLLGKRRVVVTKIKPNQGAFRNARLSRQSSTAAGVNSCLNLTKECTYVYVGKLNKCSPQF